jgi:hypothetical protein
MLTDSIHDHQYRTSPEELQKQSIHWTQEKPSFNDKNKFMTQPFHVPFVQDQA